MKIPNPIEFANSDEGGVLVDWWIAHNQLNNDTSEKSGMMAPEDAHKSLRQRIG